MDPTTKTGTIRCWIGRPLEFSFDNTTRYKFTVINAIWLDEKNIVSLKLRINKPEHGIPEEIDIHIPSVTTYLI